MKKYMVMLALVASIYSEGNYSIVDTGQGKYFDNSKEIKKPAKGEEFYGQDAMHEGNEFDYTDNRDGTISDNVTGLMWQESYEVMTYDEAIAKLEEFDLAGYTDWRLPTIKELYSLMDFGGVDISNKDIDKLGKKAKAFIDTGYFDFEYGSNGDRVIDTQLLSSTIYKGYTMKRSETVFGLNVADGRIKGYPLEDPRSKKAKEYTVRFVRGNKDYGINDFADNGDKTITDKATSLMWSKEDSEKGMDWQEALEWVEELNERNYLGYNDWRLPNAKELHSIVDYSNSPQKTGKGAIDDIFDISRIKVEDGSSDYPFFWTSTTHENINGGQNAVYIAFGEALGYFGKRDKSLVDVHGAGAQRSDPKQGRRDDYPEGRGPQGDVIRIENYVRVVRDI